MTIEKSFDILAKCIQRESKRFEAQEQVLYAPFLPDKDNIEHYEEIFRSHCGDLDSMSTKGDSHNHYCWMEIEKESLSLGLHKNATNLDFKNEYINFNGNDDDRGCFNRLEEIIENRKFLWTEASNSIRTITLPIMITIYFIPRISREKTNIKSELLLCNAFYIKTKKEFFEIKEFYEKNLKQSKFNFVSIHLINDYAFEYHEASKKTIELITLQFQREWGNKYIEYQEKFERLISQYSQKLIEFDVSHDLCNKLYEAIGFSNILTGLISNPSENANELDKSNALTMTLCQLHLLKTMFGVPWKLREIQKLGLNGLRINKPATISDHEFWKNFFELEVMFILLGRSYSNRRSIVVHFSFFSSVFPENYYVCISKSTDNKKIKELIMAIEGISTAPWGLNEVPSKKEMTFYGELSNLTGAFSELLRNSVNYITKLENDHNNQSLPLESFIINVDVKILFDQSLFEGKIKNFILPDRGVNAQMRQAPNKLKQVYQNLEIAMDESKTDSVAYHWIIKHDKR